MDRVAFADVVHQTLSFSRREPSQALVLKLVDTPWVQRLRDVSQTGQCRLLYMFAEHSRFGHSLGVAYLAELLMEHLAEENPVEVAKFRPAVSAAALLHDIGHLAPGSHSAFRTWYPDQRDTHEALSVRIIQDDPVIHGYLSEVDRQLPRMVGQILEEDPALPPWTWEIISGGGWNVDRGNWSVVDSTLAGVSYGKYNIPALIESIVFGPDGHLALRENRLDAMMHFMVSRHAMYKQIYLHRVLLAADVLGASIVQRARDNRPGVPFADDVMTEMLDSSTPDAVPLRTLFQVRDPWWRYHLLRWMESSDVVLSDLADRLVNRRLFKTVRVHDDESSQDLFQAAQSACRKAGFDPAYYLHRISTMDMHAGDSQQSMRVLMEDGTLRDLADAEPLFQAMIQDARSPRSWLVMPAEAKVHLGRTR